MLMFVFAHTTPAAEPVAGPTEPEEEVLEDVLVEGQRPISDRLIVLEWIERLAGTYRIAGSVTLHRDGGERTAATAGRAVCVVLRMQFAPAVHCELAMSRPEFGEELLGIEDASVRAPAVLVLGYAFENFHIRHLLVENGGKAEGGTGPLISPDVMFSRAACLNAPAPCERVLRVTARADLTEVRMEIGFETGDRRVLTQTLTLYRESARDVAPIDGAQQHDQSSF